MAVNIGLSGLATIKSAGTVGTGPIRVYDVAVGATSVAAAIIQVYNGINSSSTSFQALSVSAAIQHFNSNAGIRLENGCFIIATGCTATVNYMQEF